MNRPGDISSGELQAKTDRANSAKKIIVRYSADCIADNAHAARQMNERFYRAADIDPLIAELAVANATLDKLREAIPETLKYSSNGSHYVQAVGAAIDILYPKEAEHDTAWAAIHPPEVSDD